jgi:hypothetical protein
LFGIHTNHAIREIGGVVRIKANTHSIHNVHLGVELKPELLVLMLERRIQLAGVRDNGLWFGTVKPSILINVFLRFRMNFDAVVLPDRLVTAEHKFPVRDTVCVAGVLLVFCRSLRLSAHNQRWIVPVGA